MNSSDKRLGVHAVVVPISSTGRPRLPFTRGRAIRPAIGPFTDFPVNLAIFFLLLDDRVTTNYVGQPEVASRVVARHAILNFLFFFLIELQSRTCSLIGRRE